MPSNDSVLPLYPVILAGGSGTRLWPLSRKNFPKQFLCLHGDASLLQQTVQRVLQLNPAEILLVSNEAHYFICQEQLSNFKQQKFKYLLEPCVRNTAPAITAAALYLLDQAGPEAIMLVLPSDHWIKDHAVWENAMLNGITYAARQDALVTFGIKPHSPKTGYGYIEAKHDLNDDSLASVVASFHEKPDATTAAYFIQQNRYFWNSGMFAFRVGVYLSELQCYAPDIMTASQLAFKSAYCCPGFTRLEPDAFNACRSESIDYAIMEKTSKAVVMSIDIAWNDLGCWTAVAEANQDKLDKQGNVIQGNVIAEDSYNCLINSSSNVLVATIGISDQIIVATQDAILIADKKSSQQVKKIVHALADKNHQLVTNHSRVSRPWGYYEILAEGKDFKVKRLMVNPGAKLSLQMHEYRAEHWVIVGGMAEVVNGFDLLHLATNQSTYIPRRTKHRLSNPHDKPLYVIEVQSGAYLGEDDIQRFEDIYLRESFTTYDL